MVLSKLLDLPNELLVEVFQYFDVGELFNSLLGLTIRLDDVLKYYHPHHWNLADTKNLNLVCRYINPGRIRSLVVRNSEEMHVFENLFLNQEFRMNCRALTVYDTTPYHFIYIVRRLSQFKNLLAFSSIRSSSMTYTQIYSELVNSVIKNEIPTLNYLKLVTKNQRAGVRVSQSISMPISNNLKHLILSNFAVADLPRLKRSLPNLINIYIDTLSG